MRRTSIFASLLVLGTVVAVSCGGGDDELTTAIDELPRSALSTMVLTADDFGSIVDGFEVDPESGVSSNADEAENSLNPDDTASDFDDALRITGYKLDFEVADMGPLLADGEGVIAVGSEAELFESGEAASAEIQRKLEDLRDLEGQNIDGFILAPLEEFNVAGLGDESGGLVFGGRIASLDVDLFVTIVYVRIGRVNAAVGLSALGDQDLSNEAAAAAKKLEARIRGVALGEIDEDPVEIPADVAAPNTGAPVDRPEGVPDLASIALQLSDLPAGFEIDEEGYEAPPEQEFAREFGIGDGISVRIGQTEVIGLQNTVTISESAADASLLVTRIEQLLTGEQGREFFKARFADGAGFEPEVLELGSQPLQIGDEGVVILGLIRTGLGDFALAFMVVRVEQGVSMIAVTALASSFNLEDLAPLARIQEQRLRAGPPN